MLQHGFGFDAVETKGALLVSRSRQCTICETVNGENDEASWDLGCSESDRTREEQRWIECLMDGIHLRRICDSIENPQRLLDFLIDSEVSALP